MNYKYIKYVVDEIYYHCILKDCKFAVSDVSSQFDVYVGELVWSQRGNMGWEKRGPSFSAIPKNRIVKIGDIEVNENDPIVLPKELEGYHVKLIKNLCK